MGELDNQKYKIKNNTNIKINTYNLTEKEKYIEEDENNTSDMEALPYFFIFITIFNIVGSLIVFLAYKYNIINLNM